MPARRTRNTTCAAGLQTYCRGSICQDCPSEICGQVLGLLPDCGACTLSMRVSRCPGFGFPRISGRVSYYDTTRHGRLLAWWSLNFERGMRVNARNLWLSHHSIAGYYPIDCKPRLADVWLAEMVRDPMLNTLAPRRSTIQIPQ